MENIKQYQDISEKIHSHNLDHFKSLLGQDLVTILEKGPTKADFSHLDESSAYFKKYQELGSLGIDTVL